MWQDIGGYTRTELDAADAVYARWVRPRLRSGTIVSWIVDERGEPVASGSAWVHHVQPRPRHPTGATPYLLSMYTEPAHRGQGHARRIVRAAMAWAKRAGYPRMTLHASDMGRPIYESLGWERTWEMKLELAGRGKNTGRRAKGKGKGRPRSARGQATRLTRRSC